MFDLQKHYDKLRQMNAKYIIVESQDGLEYPYLFSGLTKHSDFARKILLTTDKVVAAGFASFGLNSLVNISCWGESVSLNVKSRREIDEKVFENMFKRV
jgi:hypothetical protein